MSVSIGPKSCCPSVSDPPMHPEEGAGRTGRLDRHAELFLQQRCKKVTLAHNSVVRVFRCIPLGIVVPEPRMARFLKNLAPVRLCRHIADGFMVGVLKSLCRHS